jgi:hypothetical protein
MKTLMLAVTCAFAQAAVAAIAANVLIVSPQTGGPHR